MSEMVERVAKAIFEVWAKDAGLSEDDRNWSEVVRVNHSIVSLARIEARAAIEAMREPTEAMLRATGNCQGCEPINWQAMIDVALEAPAILPQVCATTENKGE